MASGQRAKITTDRGVFWIEFAQASVEVLPAEADTTDAVRLCFEDAATGATALYSFATWAAWFHAIEGARP